MLYKSIGPQSFLDILTPLIKELEQNYILYTISEYPVGGENPHRTLGCKNIKVEAICKLQ